MRTKLNKIVLLLLLGLLFIQTKEAYSQSGVLNNDCATATLTAPNPLPLIGTWTSPSHPSIVFANPHSSTTTASNIPFNTNITFTWTVSGIPSTFVIAGFSYPLANAGSDITACDVVVNQVTLNAVLSPNTMGEWIIDQGSGIPLDPYDPNTILVGMDRELTIYRWHVTDLLNGCSSDDSVKIFYMPVSADAGPNDIEPICDNFFELSGNNPADELILPSYTATGHWDQIPPTAYEIIANPNSYATMVTNLDWGSNRFRWTVTNGICSASDDVIVRNDSPSIPIVKNDTVICSTSYFLEAAMPVRGVGVWSVVSGGADIVNETLYNTEVINLANYVQPLTPDYQPLDPAINRFQWTVTYTGPDGHQCSLDDVVDVINLLPLPANAGIDQTVCGTTANLNATCLGSGAMIHWWEEYPPNPGSTIQFYHPNLDPQTVDSTEFNTHVEGLPTGTTSFIWYKQNDLDYHGNYYNNNYHVTCMNSDTVEITSKIALADLNAGQNGTICADTISLHATLSPVFPGFLSHDIAGHWEVIEGTGTFVDPSSNSTFVSELAPTTNILRWTIVDNTDGCIYTDDVYYTNASPSNAVVGPDVQTCDDYARLTANRPVRGTGVWSVTGKPSGYTDTFSSTSCQSDECNTYLLDLIPGTYDITWTVTNHYLGPETPPATCSIDTVMHVFQRGVTANPGVGQAVCSNTTQLFGVLDAGTTGTWRSIDPAVSFSNSSIENITNNPSPNVYHLKRGSNYFRWTVTNGICSDFKDIVVYNDSPANAVINDPNGTGIIAVCDDSTSLSAQPIDIDDFGKWTFSAPYAITIANNTSLNTSVWGIPEQQSVTFIWTVTHSETHADLGLTMTCPLDTTITVFNNSVTSDAVNGVPTVCGTAGGTAQTNLSANILAPTTGIWSHAQVGDASIIATPTLFNTLVTNMAGGKHYYVWMVSRTSFGLTCQDKDTAVVNVEIPDISNAIAINENAISGATVETCADQITLRGNQPSSPENGIGIWTKVKVGGSDVFADATSYETTVSGLLNSLNERIYTWTIRTKGNCSSSDTVRVFSHGVDANAHVDGNQDVYICEDTYRLKANDLNWYNSEISYPVQATGSWVGPGGITITNPSSFETDVSGLSGGGTQNTFIWTVNKGNCTASDFVNIYNNGFTVSAGGPYESCDQTITNMAGSNPGVGSGVWERAGASGDIVSPSMFNTQIINITSPGDNYFKWTVIRDNCTAFAIATVTNNTVVADPGNYQPLCEDSVELIAGIAPLGASGVWTLEIGDPSITIENSTARITWVKNIPFGTSTFRWTLSKGSCIDYDLVSIHNLGITALGDEINACEMPVRLSGNNPAPYGATGVWSESPVGSANFIDANTLYNAKIDGVDVGEIVTFNWKISNSQCSDDVDIHVSNKGFNISAGINDDVCDNFANISAENRGTGIWEIKAGAGVFDNSLSATTVVRNLQQGDNILRWTVTDNGCTAYDEVTIRNNALLVSAGSDQTICDDYITLRATPLSPTGNGLWSGGGVNTEIDDKSSSITLVTLLSNGLNTFTWSVTDQGCSSSANVAITSNHFFANAGSDQEVTVDFSPVNAGLPPTGTGTWLPFTGSGTPDNANSPTTTIRNLNYGINEFIWRVNWKGCFAEDTVKITFNPLAADAGFDTTICANRVFMKANNPFPGTGKWTKIGIETTGEFGDDTNPLTGIFNIGIGSVNKYRWTVTINGFSIYDEVVVYNNQFPLSAGVDRPVCVDHVQMTADSVRNGSGVWTTLYGGGNFTTLSMHNAQVANLEEGPNVFVWTATKNHGCVNADTVQISFNSPPTAKFLTDINYGCSPIDVEFTNISSGGTDYYWNFGNGTHLSENYLGVVDTIRYHALYENDSTYTITLIAYSGSGCSDTVKQSVTVIRIPKVDFSPSPLVQTWPRSQVNFENLSGESYPTYYWDFGDGNQQIDNVFTTNFSHSYQTWGTYNIILAVASANCPDTASYTITINPPLPKNTGGRNYSGCAPFTVKFTNGTEYADKWFWDFDDGGTSDSITPDYTYDVPGRYIVSLYAWGPGSLTDTVFIRHDTIDVYPTPVAQFLVTPDTVMLPNSAVYGYNRSTNADLFEWDFGDNSEIETAENPIHYYTEPGTYHIILRVYTTHNCFDSPKTYATVVVENAGVCKFPNAFTPSVSGPSNGVWRDNDISNDIFHPVHRGIGVYKLEIYNRWGEKLFESDDPAIGWDGYRDKKLSPMDVYVWKVTGKYKNGVPFQAAGDVTLIR